MSRNTLQSTGKIAGLAVAVVVLSLGAGTGYRWWDARNSDEPAVADKDSATAEASLPVSRNGSSAAMTGVAREPASNPNASRSGDPETPSTAPATEVDALAARLGDYRDPDAVRASRALIGLGAGAADDVLAALREVVKAERSAAVTVTERRRLATRKLQLIVVLGTIGGPDQAAGLIDIARASDPTSLAHNNVAIALGKMGAADAARRYAHEALALDGLTAVQARGLLGLLVHFPDSGDRQIARRFMTPGGPDLTRDLGLLLAARTGLKGDVAAMAPTISAVATSSERDFYALLALAESLPPDEFQQTVAGTPLGESRAARGYYTEALMHGRFVWGEEVDKSRLLPEMLLATQAEPVIAGLKYLLESERTDWLFEYGIVTDLTAARRAQGLPPDANESLRVSPRYAGLMGFTGFRVDIAGSTPRIVRLNKG